MALKRTLVPLRTELSVWQDKEEKSILVAPKSCFSQTTYNLTSKYPCYAHFKPILKATQASRIIAVK